LRTVTTEIAMTEAVIILSGLWFCWWKGFENWEAKEKKIEVEKWVS
jgi:hypothetical protein